MMDVTHLEDVFDPFRGRRERYGPSVVGSVLVHALVVVLLMVDFSSGPDWTDQASAGGPGPVGGGGGGGGRTVGYVALPAYRPPERPQEEEERPPRPEEIVLPQAQLVQVNIEDRLEIPHDTVTLDFARVLGRGAGEGGGRGAGPGSGGGIGSGQGTGMGTGVGPGTGGGGGEIFLPSPRFASFLFEAPSSVRGKEYRIHFWISAGGDVLRVAIDPEIRDRDFRSRLVARLHEWRFNPAVRPDGTPVPAEVTITLNL